MTAATACANVEFATVRNTKCSLFLLLALCTCSFKAIAATTIIAYISALGIYRLFLHPLAKFPGPRLGALTCWYERYFDLVRDGDFPFQIEKLHKKYGE